MKGSGKPKQQTKQLGRAQLLTKRIENMINIGQGEYARDLQFERDMLLTNGRRPPIPPRMLNQRQKRKLKRSNPQRKTK